VIWKLYGVVVPLIYSSAGATYTQIVNNSTPSILNAWCSANSLLLGLALHVITCGVGLAIILPNPKPSDKWFALNVMLEGVGPSQPFDRR
jgi:hypothetical protein